MIITVLSLLLLVIKQMIMTIFFKFTNSKTDLKMIFHTINITIKVKLSDKPPLPHAITGSF